jgi:predicted transcriptional regulator
MDHAQEIIHIRVSRDLAAELRRLAELEERPLSAWARRALREVAQRQVTGQQRTAA